ncbi:MAG: L-asparaginase II [Verrucomicrobiales bacterium]
MSSSQSLSFMSSSAPLRVVLSRDSAESEHLVDVAIVDEHGLVGSHGSADRPVIPRSAIKPIQVLPLVRTGAAAAFKVTDEELALGAASHSGEEAHIEAVEAWLARIGLDPSALECGAADPISDDAYEQHIRAGGTKAPILSCCSGKHTGFLTIAQHLGVDPAGYVERDHPVQQLIIDVVAEFTGVDLESMSSGIDGCGIPTFALPLHALARSMATLVRPLGDANTVSAAKTVSSALAENPYWISGTDRQEMRLADAALEPLVSKTGAEGVFMAALPDRGIGIALKARDGARRGADMAMFAVLETLGATTPGLAIHDVTNAAGTVVGTMQVHTS